MGHVNLMDDVLVSNLPTAMLRSALRVLLSQGSTTQKPFVQHVRQRLTECKPALTDAAVLFPAASTDVSQALQTYLAATRCLFSSKLVQESLPYLSHLAAAIVSAQATWGRGSPLAATLTTAGGDIVQAIQALKEVDPAATAGLQRLLRDLLSSLQACRAYCAQVLVDYPFGRSERQVQDVLVLLYPQLAAQVAPVVADKRLEATIRNNGVGTFSLGPLTVPRLFNGFWQLSSPAWGAGTSEGQTSSLVELVEAGLTAADMADHYGDAELVYGDFRNRLPAAVQGKVYCATKWCVFGPLGQAITAELVLEKVLERSRRVGGRLDLLQFHWHDYEAKAYLDILVELVRLTKRRPELVSTVGLCNFDTQHLEEACEHLLKTVGEVGIVSNQVQFSLFDSRPLKKMVPACEKYGVQLLTYGSLCGGMLAAQWIGQPPPEIYSTERVLTPSQRKYIEVIRLWSSWGDFQELLGTLAELAVAHGVSVANVATRWVLQQPAVGAVIVGTRLGVSSRWEENLRVFGWTLGGGGGDGAAGRHGAGAEGRSGVGGAGGLRTGVSDAIGWRSRRRGRGEKYLQIEAKRCGAVRPSKSELRSRISGTIAPATTRAWAAMDDDDSKAAIKAAITAASPDEAEGPRKMTPNACTQCRRVKMKCLFRDGRDVCERCTRLQMECVRERHRRGRKLGTRLKPTANGTHEVVFVEDRPPPSAPLPPATETDESRENTWTGNLWADVDGFQPPDLLNKPEEKGRLSLQAILNGSVPSKRVVSDAAASEKDAQLGPIAVGIINRPVAMSLFEEFMRHFNPWICQFDPALHTFEYVRDRSPLLFTVILATAARAFNPALREPLQAHAERLLSRSVIHGPKSVEVAHAILVVTCWKEPEDTRTWMLVGHAIRMAHELGWHRMQLGGSGGDQTAETRRRRRDVERVWLLLFVCDRNLSFQTGNPWMIERSEVFLEARDSWGRDSLAAPHDQMLCALLDLRLLTSDTFRPSHPKHRGSDPGTTAAAAEVSQFDQRGSLVRIISHDVDRWQRRWMQTPALAAVPCHVLLLRLYGAHLRLLLASSPLEASLATHGAVDKRALWQTFSSAVDMLHALCDPPLQPSLYFAYDSIHVETAYAAVFLVKLCLRLPLETSSELEPVARDSLRATRHTFSRQAAPANSVCALQASFLANVLRAFDTAMRARRLEQAKTGHPVDAAGEPRSQPTAPASSASPAVRPGPAWPTPWAEGTDMSVDPSPAGPSSSPAAAQAPLRMVPPAFPGWRTGEDSVAFGDRGGAFPDDEVWSTMFTNSGFSIDSGTFTHSM